MKKKDSIQAVILISNSSTIVWHTDGKEMPTLSWSPGTMRLLLNSIQDNSIQTSDLRKSWFKSLVSGCNIKKCEVISGRPWKILDDRFGL